MDDYWKNIGAKATRTQALYAKRSAVGKEYVIQQGHRFGHCGGMARAGKPCDCDGRCRNSITTAEDVRE